MQVRQALVTAVPLGLLMACASQRASFDDPNESTEETSPGGAGEPGGFDDKTPPADDKSEPNGRDPVTCEEAKWARSYVGCDYWPTVAPNVVQDVFDFAVAVANVGDTDAEVSVTGPGGVNEKVKVAAGSLEKIFLPWVGALKGPQLNGSQAIPTTTTLARSSAYHLVSSRPVVVYQFNPLEFKASGGPPGKDWSACVKAAPLAPECYSYSNDASLLLPSTAMTGAYRVMGAPGFSRTALGNVLPSYFLVTATANGTNVSMKLGAKATVVGGGGIPSTPASGSLSVKLDAGDVALVATELGRNFDVSGTLVTADKPVQVISGVACADMPYDVQACDHIEETVFPAETLGKHYVVPRPTGPFGHGVSHIVRFFGNVDGTTLTYKPSLPPPGCPSKLNAGEVVQCGQVGFDFEVSGDHEFGVAVFLLGGEIVDPNVDPLGFTQPQGDPSQSFAVTVEQYRKRYVFLAPPDYKTNYVDVIGAPNTKLTLDGEDVSSAFKTVKETEWQLARLKLGAGKDGAHVLEANAPVGIQVLGYGDNTSYHYPGGLNLGQISAAPVK